MKQKIKELFSKQDNKKQKKRMSLFVFALLCLSALVYYSIYSANAKNTIARELSYTPINTGSNGLTATNVQDAIDQLYGFAETGQIVDPNTTYLVQFECNDCTSDTDPTSQMISPGGKVTKPTDPEYEDGMIFSGWYTDTTYQTLYNFNSEVNSNMILYADKQLSSPILQYEITFDKNSADATGTMPNQTFTCTEQCESQKLSKNLYERYGYKFVGWNTKADGTGTSYADEATIAPTADMTLYAQWANNNYSVSLTIIKNEGEDGCLDETLDCMAWSNSGINVALYQNGQVKYAYSSATTTAATVTFSNVTPGTYDVYAGKGNNDKTTLVDSGVNVSVTTSDVHTYITYYKLDVIGTGNITTTGSGYYLGGVTVPVTASNFGEGYRFAHWRPGKGDLPKTQEASSTVTVTQYSYFTAIVAEYTYSINFYHNDGTGDSTTTANIRYTEQFTFQEPLTTYEGYTFVKWNTAQDGSGTDYLKGQTVSKLCLTDGSSIDLYAIWEKNIVQSTVTYDYATNGGTSATKASDTINSGSAVDLTPTATKAGYTFVGWNVNSNAHDKLNSLNIGDNNITLYAIFRKNDSYSVSFNQNGSTLSGGTNSKNCYAYNNETGCDVTLTSPSITRNGYEAVGFNKSATGKESEWNSNTEKTITLNSNTTYYAITKKLIDITYNSNGNTITIDGHTASNGNEIVFSCYIYNSESECQSTTPTITGNSNTPNIIGYKKTSNSLEGDTLAPGTTININENGYKSTKVWYAVTTSNTNNYTVTYTKGTGVSSIGKTSDKCTTEVTYNGVAPSNSCSVTLPSITPENNADSVNWSDGTSSYRVNQVVSINSNKSFEAKAIKPQYTVTFNTHGGTAVQSQTVERGGKATTPSNPTKLGYNFEGWYTDSSYQYRYNFNTEINGNIELHAHYTEKANPTSYIVSFQTGGGSPVESQNVLEGRKVIRPSNPVRDKYEFGGWYVDYECTTPYSFDSPVGNDFVLYAKWNSLSIYHTVSFNTDGGSTVPNQKVYEGNTVNIPVEPTKANSVFLGWYRDSAKTTPYNFDTKVTSDITLYAKWYTTSSSSSTKKYVVSFLSNGGTNVAPIEVEENHTINRPSNPTKEDYTFGGWYLDDTLQHEFDFNSRITNSITLYAKWVPVDSNITTYYKVKFESNGGTYIYNQNVIKGGYVSEPRNPSKSGYIFSGWYTNNQLTSLYTFNTPVTSDITLYAKWEEEHGYGYVPQITVTFNLCTNDVLYPSAIDIPKGGMLGNFGDPEREGYTFAGWYKNAQYTIPFDIYSDINDDITIYARWYKNDSLYTVTFNSNGGTAVPSQTIKEGNTVNVPIEPTRSGYTFGGWYNNSTPYIFSTPVMSNLTLTAKWNKNSEPVSSKKYTVVFISNGGTAVNSIEVNANELVPRPNNPIKPGYVFNGWFLDDELTTEYTFNTGITKTLVLYARWIPESTNIVTYYKVNFETNGGSYIGSTTVQSGQVVARPNDPYKGGYEFKGWYTNNDFIKIYNFDNPVHSDITLYARWQSSAGGNVIDNGNGTSTVKGNNSNASVTLPTNTVNNNNVSGLSTENISNSEKERVKSLIDNAKDVSGVVVNLVDNNSNPVDVSGTSIKYRIPLPSGFSSSDTLKVYRIDGNNKEEIPFTINNGNVEFTYNGTGEFVIVKINKGNSGGNGGNGGNSGNSGNTPSGNGNTGGNSGTNTGTGNVSGNTSGNSSGNTSGNSSGNSSGNTSGNTNNPNSTTGTSSNIINNGDNTSKVVDNTGNGGSATIDNQTIKDKDIATFTDTPVTGSEKEKVKELLPEADTVDVFDTTVSDSTGNKVDLSDKLITYRMPIPSDVKPTDNIKVYRIVGDTKEEIPFTIENGYIVFTTNGTGRYVIASFPKQEFGTTDGSGSTVQLNDDLANIVDRTVIEDVDEKTKKELVDEYFKDSEDAYIFNSKFYDNKGNKIDISNNYIVYSIPIPKGMKTTDNIYVYQIKNGKKVRLDYKIKGGKIVFGAEGEGPFSIVKYKEEYDVIDNPTKEHKITPWIIGSTLLALIALIGYIFVVRITKKNKDI